MAITRAAYIPRPWQDGHRQNHRARCHNHHKKLEEQGKLETVKRVCQRLSEIMIFVVKAELML